ncbi:MAG TPA: hypothetical protein VGT08_02480 [Terracidiphilus sp.]|nr:hypothetical protein [Terracidiphilus sp.]
MNSRSQNASAHNSISDASHEAVSSPAETTLRLIATLPAPDGLEDRVMAGLKAAPRTARVLHWPEMLQPTGSWIRGAAAAAIVFVVTGGGWGIYTRVQPARVIAMPPRTGAAGGFSNAGAMRTPQTLNGPVVDQSGEVPAVSAQPVQVKPVKKAPVRIAPVKHGQAQAVPGKKASAQLAVSAAK